MIDRNDVATFAARNLAVVVFFMTAGRGVLFDEISFGLIASSLVISLLFWVIAFLFALALLLPLERVFLKASETHSFLAFLIIGSSIPIAIMIGLNSLMNRFQSFDETEITAGVFGCGVFGAITAASAWWRLTNRSGISIGN
jgi:hypothetical protein